MEEAEEEDVVEKAEKDIDVLSPVAMDNAYSISHNIQVWLQP